jgi:hypothetical protein
VAARTLSGSIGHLYEWFITTRGILKMSVKNPITVNGIILSEYVKDNDSRISRIRGENLKKEGHDAVNLYNKPIIRHKKRKEKNGDVKIMGNYELNRQNYQNYLIQELKSTNSLTNLCVIVLLCGPDSEYHTSKSVSDILIKQTKKLNMPVNERLEYAVRARLGAIKKSALADYMLLPKRKAGMPTFYSIRQETKDSLTIEKAIELSKIKKAASKAKSRTYDLATLESDKVSKKATIKTENTFPEIEKLFEIIEKLDKNKNVFFVVCGNFTLNLHLTKE